MSNDKTICSPNTPTGYFKITVPAYSLTCSPAQIVTAADSPNNRVTNFSGTINLTTSSSRGDWAKQSAQGSLNNGVADDGAASYQFTTADQGVATLNLDHIVAGSVNITVTSGNIQSSAGPIQFVAEGYQLDFGQKLQIFSPLLNRKSQIDHSSCDYRQFGKTHHGQYVRLCLDILEINQFGYGWDIRILVRHVCCPYFEWKQCASWRAKW